MFAFISTRQLNNELGILVNGGKHSAKYRTMRAKFGYLTDEQFSEIYRSLCGSTGIVNRNAMPYSDREKGIIEDVVNAILDNHAPISLTDALRESGYQSHVRYISRHRLLKALKILGASGDWGFTYQAVKTCGGTAIYLFMPC